MIIEWFDPMHRSIDASRKISFLTTCSERKNLSRCDVTLCGPHAYYSKCILHFLLSYPLVTVLWLCLRMPPYLHPHNEGLPFSRLTMRLNWNPHQESKAPPCIAFWFFLYSKGKPFFLLECEVDILQSVGPILATNVVKFTSENLRKTDPIFKYYLCRIP